MKKSLLILFAICSISTAFSQEIGLRFGEISGGNIAIDGIFSTGNYSRLHADVSFGRGVGADLLWDFLYRPLGEEAFDWYVGAGPYTFIGHYFELGIVGEIGLEYHFKGIPLAIGADYRPGLRIIDNTDLFWDVYGFNFRWVFGN